MLLQPLGGSGAPATFQGRVRWVQLYSITTCIVDWSPIGWHFTYYLIKISSHLDEIPVTSCIAYINDPLPLAVYGYSAAMSRTSHIHDVL